MRKKFKTIVGWDSETKESLRFQGVLRGKAFRFSHDARDVQKSPARSHTETMTCGQLPGLEGANTAGSREWIKTVGLYSGKDTADLVDRNILPFYHEMAELEKNGIVYDSHLDSYFGVREYLEPLIEHGKVRIDEETGVVHETKGEVEEASKQYEFEKVEFFCTLDMASAFSACNHGGKSDKQKMFCIYCHEQLRDRKNLFSLITVANDVSLSAFAETHDMYVSTFLFLNSPEHSEYFDAFTSAEAQHHGAESKQGESIGKNKRACGKSVIQSGKSCANYDFLPGDGSRGRSSIQRGQRNPIAVAELKVTVVQHPSEGWKRDEDGSSTIPAGTVVRVVRKNPVERVSERLSNSWLQFSTDKTLKRLIFCTLHADMRLSEGLILILFRKICCDSNSIKELNKLLREQGISEQFYQQKESVKWHLRGLTGSECEKLRDQGTL